mgnify:CR=1 FL=1
METAERARAQTTWILRGALDWARLILQEDARAQQGGQVDHLGEPWALPVLESKLSTFLSQDQKWQEGDAEVFLSGHINDAQSRLNVRNLVDNAIRYSPPQAHIQVTVAVVQPQPRPHGNGQELGLEQDQDQGQVKGQGQDQEQSQSSENTNTNVNGGNSVNIEGDPAHTTSMNLGVGVNLDIPIGRGIQGASCRDTVRLAREMGQETLALQIFLECPHVRKLNLKVNPGDKG